MAMRILILELFLVLLVLCRLADYSRAYWLTVDQQLNLPPSPMQGNDTNGDSPFQQNTRTQNILTSSINASVVVSKNSSSSSDNLPEEVDDSKVCLYGSMRFFFSENTTERFALNLLTVLRDVSLRSFNDAVQTRGNKVKVLCPISTYKPHFASHYDLLKFMQPIVSTYTNLDVDFSPKAYWTAKQHFKTTSCGWVVSIKLDADDVLAPGYVDWLVQDVVPSLSSNESSAAELSGALVASRTMPQIVMGYNRCISKSSGRGFWSGWAVGQTKVLRRQAFLKMNCPFQAQAHTWALTQLRKAGYKYQQKQVRGDRLREQAEEEEPLLLRDLQSYEKNMTYQQEHDTELEHLTGIRMIDSVEAGFGSAGIYLMTPLSGHFSFQYKRLLQRTSWCTTTPQWHSAVEDTKKDNLQVQPAQLDYIHNVVKTMRPKILDLCESHDFFKKFNFSVQVEGATCNDMERNYRERLLINRYSHLKE